MGNYITFILLNYFTVQLLIKPDSKGEAVFQPTVQLQHICCDDGPHYKFFLLVYIRMSVTGVTFSLTFCG